MYDPTYLKPLKFFMVISGTKNIVVMLICRIFQRNLDIILIIMLYFWDKSLNCPYKIVEFFIYL
jgi:hypothetical protein